MYPSSHTYVCPIHMYAGYCQSSRGKFWSPRRDDRNRQRITNVDRLSGGCPNARLLFNSPSTCGRTERISRRDGRRCRVLKFKAFYLQRSRQAVGCKGKTADGNITRPCASLRENNVTISSRVWHGETLLRFAIQNN